MNSMHEYEQPKNIINLTKEGVERISYDKHFPGPSLPMIHGRKPSYQHSDVSTANSIFKHGYARQSLGPEYVILGTDGKGEVMDESPRNALEKRAHKLTKSYTVVNSSQRPKVKNELLTY